MRKDVVRQFRKNLREFERILTDSYECTCSDSGVTMAQCHMLIELESANLASVKDLAERLRLDRSTVSRTVDGLVGLGLVERRENPSDRRLQTLRLSQKGIDTTERLHRENDVYFGQVLKNVPRELRSDVLGAFEILVQASRDQPKRRR